MSHETMLEVLQDNLNKHMEICDLKRKVKKLTAENERLRKAGDDLAVAWAKVRTDYHTWDVAVKAWDAAKEGVRK